MWNHSGSHNVPSHNFDCQITHDGTFQTGKVERGITWNYKHYYLRGLHSTHTSNKEFWRMIALIYSHHNLCLPVLICSVTVVKTVKTFATTVNILCVMLLFSTVNTWKCLHGASSFYKELNKLEVVLKEKERNNPECEPGFCNWFCTHKIDAIMSGIVKPVREEAGLYRISTYTIHNQCKWISECYDSKKVNYNINELPALLIT